MTYKFRTCDGRTWVSKDSIPKDEICPGCKDLPLAECADECLQADQDDCFDYNHR